MFWTTTACKRIPKRLSLIAKSANPIRCQPPFKKAPARFVLRASLNHLRPNMSRNVAPMWLVPLIIAFAIAGLAPLSAHAQAPGQNWTQSGMLRCRLNPSIGFVIFGHQSMECRFVPSRPGAPQIYEGALNTVGIDVGVISAGA